MIVVSHFIESFRRAEGLLFGYSNVVLLKYVVIDRSLVLLLSFNFCVLITLPETLSDYLHRCFRIVTGCSSR